MPLKRKTRTTLSPDDSIKKQKHESNQSIDIPIENCLMWFRTDLRIQDNIALHKASTIIFTKSEKSNYVFAIYLISPEEWRSHDVAPTRVDFWLRNLKELKKSLNELNIPLIIENVDNASDVPSVMIDWCKRLRISHLFANIEYEVDEMKRDKQVFDSATSNSIKVEMLHSQCIVKPGLLKTKEGKPYRVYTPFKNSWFRHVESDLSILESSPIPFPNSVSIRNSYLETFSFKVPSSIPGFEISSELAKITRFNFPAGEQYCHSLLSKFLLQKVSKYSDARDILSQNGTSSLSPYLASGIISARQCVYKAFISNNNKLSTGKNGIVKWIKEIIWREFYRQILVAFPHVCKNMPFKKHMKNIEWNNDEENFRRWCQGKTGYPIVDAGMRQLNGMCWMHNRARMIVAMKGERYFMSHLIDGDFANNNGGWQWCASTGSDAQPYFRIFNPTTQSEKFDPTGEYIRKWVPELKHLDSKQIHNPFGVLNESEFKKLGYPKPIVDHQKARVVALERFKKVK
ncbi:9513_t:CDS:2 [Funneliformis caledonium]|uniref:9513_t:CDS:1 n=1 Tax=Funneliformis caledonium TaxID=1117310 RepID=A0A9N9FE19_9GLOM|nr:9513_t:CDS:2 [Funneliformis caledonium]